MSFCPNCGSQLNDNDAFCGNCGLPVAQAGVQPNQPIQPNVQTYVAQRATHYENGGLIAWSIITLLLCTIPGIVALIKACKINGDVTPEEQVKLISDTKTWCTIGTILGVIAIIVTIVQNYA